MDSYVWARSTRDTTALRSDFKCETANFLNPRIVRPLDTRSSKSPGPGSSHMIDNGPVGILQGIAAWCGFVVLYSCGHWVKSSSPYRPSTRQYKGRAEPKGGEGTKVAFGVVTKPLLSRLIAATRPSKGPSGTVNGNSYPAIESSRNHTCCVSTAKQTF